MAAATIYKLLTRAEWEAAQQEGYFFGSAHDERDGFIHFSTAAQLGETARKHFSGVPDLVLLAVEVAGLENPFTPHPAASQPPSPARGEGNSAGLPSPLRGRGDGGEGGFLRFEPSRGGDLFPHLYAPLPISAVKSAIAVPLAGDSTPVIPDGLEP